MEMTTTTNTTTFTIVSDLVADLDKHNDIAVQFNFDNYRYPRNFKASNILADGVFQNRLKFELDFSDSIYSHIAVESASKTISSDGSAAYTVRLKDGIGTDGYNYNNAIITITAKNNPKSGQPRFDCDCEELEFYIPETYYMDKSLIDESKSYYDEQNQMQIDVLDLNRLGILSDRQRLYIKSFMLDIVQANYKENKTFCVISNGESVKYLGVYGLDSGRVLGKMLVG